MKLWAYPDLRYVLTSDSALPIRYVEELRSVPIGDPWELRQGAAPHRDSKGAAELQDRSYIYIYIPFYYNTFRMASSSIL